MNSIRFTLQANRTEQHASHAQYDDRLRIGWPEVIYSARAEAPDLSQDHPQLYACLEALGFTVPDDVGQLVKEGHVEWGTTRIGSHAQVGLASGPYAKNHFDFNAPPATIVGSDGEARLVVDMNHEPDGPYPDGVLKQGPSSLRAKLDISQMPDIKDLIQAALPSGLTDALIAVLSGWYANWFGPEAEAGFRATWHEPCEQSQAATSLQGAAPAADQCRPPQWSGTITVVRERQYEESGPNGTSRTDEREQTTYTLGPVDQGDFYWYAPYQWKSVVHKATAAAQFDGTYDSEMHNHVYGCEGDVLQVDRNTETGSGSSNDFRAGISTDPSNGSSVFIAVRPTTPSDIDITFPTTYSQYRRLEFPSECGGTREETLSGTGERLMIYDFEFYATRDPQNPNILAGSVESRSGVVVTTTTWNLTRR